RLTPKAAARSQIAVTSVSIACRSIHQDDVERLQLIVDRATCLLKLPCRYNMARLHGAKVELNPRSEKPVQWHLINGHCALAAIRSRGIVPRRIHMRSVMGRNGYGRRPSCRKCRIRA